MFLCGILDFISLTLNTDFVLYDFQYSISILAPHQRHAHFPRLLQILESRQTYTECELPLILISICLLNSGTLLTTCSSYALIS